MENLLNTRQDLSCEVSQRYMALTSMKRTPLSSSQHLTGYYLHFKLDMAGSATKLDIKTAFLNGELEHEIFVEPPDGYPETK